MLNGFWHNLSTGARAGLGAGVAVIVLGTAAAAFWLLRTEYQVLFSELSPQDTAAMAAELDRMKTPYKLDDGGSAILVDKEAVPRLRLKLMGKELPLHGAVGFELFNNADFGMTEFAQKINYQRALQGEISRTILALAEIRDVRVHLAIPEQGLFKQQANRPKAAINVTLKPGESLRKEQVVGIQRLVSSAVPGMALQDVALVDQHGVALSRSAAEQDGEAGTSQLDLKRETEQYLARKVGAVLEQTFGPGQAIASVDVSLNMDQVRSTQESVVAPPPKQGETATGIVVRERETIHEAGSPLELKAAEAAGAVHGGSSQHEFDYQVGRRVEQIVSQPGSIQRLHVVAVIHQRLDEARTEQVRRIVAAASGIALERGDTVEVQSLDVAAPLGAATPAMTPTAAAVGPGADSKPHAPSASSSSPHPVVVSLLLLLGVTGVGAVLMLRRGASAPPAALSGPQRQAALEQVQHWLRQPGEMREPL